MAWVGVAAGAVSMLFGLLYGSIFGYEDVLEPVWLSPMHHPEHVLTVAELPAHTHPPLTGTEYAMDNDGGTGASTGSDVANGLTEASTTGSEGDDEPHNNLPPYRGCYLIKRTARIFWVG